MTAFSAAHTRQGDTPRPFVRRRILAPAMVMGLSVWLGGCGQDQASLPAMPAPAVSVYAVEARPVGDYREFVARTQASQEATLTARLEGQLQEILFTEGSVVEAGQLLMRIEGDSYRASTEQGEAELRARRDDLAAAQRDLARGQEVASKGYLSQADLDKLKDRVSQATAALNATQASLEKTRINLGYTDIRAPFAGRIGKAHYSVGNVVSPASGSLAELYAIDPIYVNFQVNEVDFLNFRSRQRQQPEATPPLDVRLKLPNGALHDQPGQIDFADVKSDTGTGTVAVRAVFANSQGVVLPGLYVTLVLESRDKTERVLVPQIAVQESQEGKFVLVVDGDNNVRQRLVKPGLRVGPFWAIESGLDAGERVIVEGLQKVKPGVAVAPVLKTMDPDTGALSDRPTGG